MKDQRGLYYYPFPQNKRVRMYVRPGRSEPEFRLWNRDDDGLWKSHGWVPYTAILEARQLYRGGAFDPDKAYDIQAAKALIAEGG